MSHLKNDVDSRVRFARIFKFDSNCITENSTYIDRVG